MTATNFPDVPNTTLQRLLDVIVSSVRRQGGKLVPAPPNAFKDRLQENVTLTGPTRTANPVREVMVELRTNPDGNSAYAKVRPLGPAGAEAIEGQVDIPTLLGFLGQIDVTTATDTLVAGTKNIALANNVGDRLAVLVTAAGGTPGILSVSRVDAGHVVVDSWLAGTGIQVLDTSTVKVYNFGPDQSAL